MARGRITLECEVCSRRNYTATKRRDNGERVAYRKYCSHCASHTVHREAR